MTSHSLLKTIENIQDYASELKKPISNQRAIIEDCQVLTIWTENSIFFHNIQSSPKWPKWSVLPLQFKVNFSVQYKQQDLKQNQKLGSSHPISITLQSEQCQQKLILESKNNRVLKSWIKQLSKRINQRNLEFHYQLAHQLIDLGSFGMVQRIRRKQDSKVFAMKSINKKVKYAPGKGRQSVQNQINILRHVNHSNIINLNIIKLEGVFQSNDHIYMIMKYIQGEDLLKTVRNQLKQKKNFTSQRILKISSNILKALAYLASFGIAHRDIKPENILLRKDSTRVVICDLELAKLTNQQQFTSCGTVVPQILNQHNHPFRCNQFLDTFSFELNIYMLLAQRYIQATRQQRKFYNTINYAHEFLKLLTIQPEIPQQEYRYRKRLGIHISSRNYQVKSKNTKQTQIYRLKNNYYSRQAHHRNELMPQKDKNNMKNKKR